MNISPHSTGIPMNFSRICWTHWILIISVLLFVDIDPVMTIPLTEAKDIEVGKPIIQKPVKPKVREETLENLPKAEPWKPGDPIRVRPDLRRSDDLPKDDSTSSPRLDKDPCDQSSENPATQKCSDNLIQEE